jgi:ribosomal protein S16
MAVKIRLTRMGAKGTLKEDLVRSWLAKGAKPTLTVSKLLIKKGIAVPA